MCRRWVFERKGKLLNDTTVEVYSDYSYWGGDSLLHTPCVLNYYHTNIKPDSTNAWFEKKRWYKKGLHESRQ